MKTEEPIELVLPENVGAKKISVPHPPLTTLTIKEEVYAQEPVSAAKSEQSIQQTSVVINFDGVDDGVNNQELYVGSHLRANDQSLNESH